jgi:hypothetical protein
MASLPKAIAFRAEPTGHAGADRAQRMAQDVGRAHEQTKAYVKALVDSTIAALANQAYAALAVDTNLATSASYLVMLTANITTVLASGHLVISFSASGLKLAALGSNFFEIVVDGVVMKGCYHTTPAAAYAWSIGMMVRVPVTAGLHVVQLQWRTDSNSSRVNAASIPEEHMHLLAQEAA